jgi:ABC-2 type transport system permease protein
VSAGDAPRAAGQGASAVAPAGEAGAAGATATHGSSLPAMSGAAWGPLRREWIKLLFQRRSYMVWAGAALIPFLIALGLRLAGDPHESGGPPFFERILGNGMYVPLAALVVLLPFMLPLAAAMVGGYMIAGEAELGTMRIILLRPVRRGALLVVKWAAAMLYLLAGFGFMVASGLLFGAVFFGLDPMVLISGSTVGVGHGLALIALSCLYGLAAMAALVSLAMLISVLTDSSLTALIGTFVIYVAIQVIISISYFDWLRPWIFPTYFEGFVDLWRDPIYWRPILKGLAAFGLWSAGLTALAYVLFRRKDVLS